MPKQRIVIIDDDIDTLNILEYILTEEGYEAITGSNSIVLNDCEKTLPALILLDNWLGQHSGHDICLELKSNPKTSGIPIILISAANRLKQTATSCKADGFIIKPFEVAELIKKVSEFIKVNKDNTSY